MSPLWEPRKLEPQSPRCTGLHLSTAPALAVGGAPVLLGQHSQDSRSGQRQPSGGTRRPHAVTPQAAARLRQGRKCGTHSSAGGLSATCHCPNQTWKMHFLHKTASVSASKQAQPSPWLHHLLSNYCIQQTLGKSSKSMITFPLSPRTQQLCLTSQDRK